MKSDQGVPRAWVTKSGRGLAQNLSANKARELDEAGGPDAAAAAAAPWVNLRLATRCSHAANCDDSEFKVDNYEQLCTKLDYSRE